MGMSPPTPFDRKKACAVVDAVFGVTEDWQHVFGGHFTDELHWQIFHLMMMPPQPISEFIKEKQLNIFPFSWLCEYLPRREELDYDSLLARARDATEHGLLLEGQGLQQRCFLTTEHFYEKCTRWTTRSFNRFVHAIHTIYGNSPSTVTEIYKRGSNIQFMNFWDKYGVRWCNALGEILENECFPLDDRVRIQKKQFTATRWHILACVFRRVAEIIDDKAENYLTIGEMVDRVTKRIDEPCEKVTSAAHELVRYGVLQRLARPGDSERFRIALEDQGILTRHFADTLDAMHETTVTISSIENDKCDPITRLGRYQERFSPIYA